MTGNVATHHLVSRDLTRIETSSEEVLATKKVLYNVFASDFKPLNGNQHRVWTVSMENVCVHCTAVPPLHTRPFKKIGCIFGVQFEHSYCKYIQPYSWMKTPPGAVDFPWPPPAIPFASGPAIMKSRIQGWIYSLWSRDGKSVTNSTDGYLSLTKIAQKTRILRHFEFAPKQREFPWIKSSCAKTA